MSKFDAFILIQSFLQFPLQNFNLTLSMPLVPSSQAIADFYMFLINFYNAQAFIGHFYFDNIYNLE